MYGQGLDPKEKAHALSDHSSYKFYKFFYPNSGTHIQKVSQEKLPYLLSTGTHLVNSQTSLLISKGEKKIEILRIFMGKIN